MHTLKGVKSVINQSINQSHASLWCNNSLEGS